MIAAALTGLLLVLAACAAGPNTVAQAASANPAGFWPGLWHGFICPITFVISLFNDNVGVYEVHNNGHLYDFGFVLGVVIGGSIFHGPRYVNRRRARSDR